MSEEPKPLALEDHLRLGYDYYVFGRAKLWTPQALVDGMLESPELVAQAKTKQTTLKPLIQRCFISRTHARVISEGLRGLDAAQNSGA